MRHDLGEWIDEYLQAAGIADDPPDSPLWRQAPTRWAALTTRRLRTSGVRTTLKTRLAAVPQLFQVVVGTNDRLSTRHIIGSNQLIVGQPF